MLKENWCGVAIALVLAVPQVGFAGGGDEVYVPPVIPMSAETTQVVEAPAAAEKPAVVETPAVMVEKKKEEHCNDQDGDNDCTPAWFLLAAGGVVGALIADGGGSSRSGDPKPPEGPEPPEPPKPPVTTTTTTTTATTATTTATATTST